jgi:hypothetical protein
MCWPNSDTQIYNGYEYMPPRRFEFLKTFPRDLAEYGRFTFQKEYLSEWIELGLMTAWMVAIDEPLIVDARELGNQLNISSVDKTREFFRILDQPIRFPTDLGSAIYFIGDGWLHLGISSSFYAYGKFTHNNRSLQTASQIAEAMATAGFMSQVLKHITGRISPFRAGDPPSDRWIPFPNQVEYHKHVSHYDAFPSGHMAVCMATVTVIAENYSEYKLIKPLGYGAMTLLGWQMMNNGVHWISDYPLAIAMGYYLGIIAVDHGRTQVGQKGFHSRLTIGPFTDKNNTTGISFKYQLN